MNLKFFSFIQNILVDFQSVEANSERNGERKREGELKIKKQKR